MIALLVALLLAPATRPPTTTQAFPEMRPAAEVPLAVEVYEAHGGEAWADVATLRYTFVVENDGEELVRREHVWDKAAGEATVDGETTRTHDGEGPAYEAWVNDAYWLVAPLKLMDGGVRAVEMAPQPDGTRLLLVGFDGVGLTPGDHYLYEVEDDGTVRAWTYLPNETSGRRFEWSGYGAFGPLTLSLDHVTADGFRVRFENVSVEVPAG